MAGELADVYLRFEGKNTQEETLEGDCTDLKHPGKDTIDANGKLIKGGWIQIKSFSFGFGFETSSSKAAGRSKAPMNREMYDLLRKQGLSPAAAEEAASRPQSNGTTATPAANKEKNKEWGHSGALNFERVRISKSADALSDDLVSMCHYGDMVKSVTLEACRPSGTDDDVDHKVPFLIITFENVFIRSCNLRLATEGLPTEEYELEYAKITVETLWTDNATGNRNPEKPISATWDLDAHAQPEAEG